MDLLLVLSCPEKSTRLRERNIEKEENQKGARIMENREDIGQKGGGGRERQLNL